MFERFTASARRVVVLAQDEARRVEHDYIGPEHVLLGLLRDEEAVPARVLASLDVTLHEVRSRVERIVGRGERTPVGSIPFTPRTKKVVELSLREAVSIGHHDIRPEHLLLGLLCEGENVAVRILAELTNPAAVRADLLRALGVESHEYPDRSPQRTPASSRRLDRVAVPGRQGGLALPLVLGWLLFATALGVGVLIGWAIWG